MKKLLALFLALLMMFALVACGDDATDGGDDEDKYKENKVIKTSETIGEDTFDFENIDSETVRITNFRSLNNEAHDVKIPAKLDGKTVIAIGTAAFEYKSNVKNVIFPALDDFGDAGKEEGFTFTIEAEAFYECAIQSLTIPAYVTEIGEGAFLACRSLQSITIADGSKLTEFAPYLFMSCEKLESVTVPAFIKKVGDGAFFGCVSLGEFTAEEGVEEIGKQAVQNCDALAKITLPASLKTLGKYAFNGSKALYDDGIIYAGSDEAILDYIESLSLEPRPIPEEE